MPLSEDARGHAAFIGLGSNLENPAAQVHAAMSALDTLPDTRLVARSSLYRSEPLGYRDQPDFINAVACVETTLDPHALLDALLALESRAGRVRDFRNSPRTLDLDVLLYGDIMLHDPGLTVPHPRLAERAFALRPLLEIAPDCVIPGCGRADSLLYLCADQRLERVDPEEP